jgi:hypothetical protein
MLDVSGFSAIRICNEKCKCGPKGNKQSKNQPLETRIK